MVKDFNLEDTVINLKLSRKELVNLTRILELFKDYKTINTDVFNEAYSFVKNFTKHFNQILEESKDEYEVLTDVEKEHDNEYKTLFNEYDHNEDVVVERIKRKYPHTMSIFKQIQEDQFTLFAYKQDDYGPGNIAMNGNFLLSLLALGVRMNDKTQRILHILNNKMLTDGDIHDVNNEPLEDSFKDLSVYGIIAQVVLSHKWGK